jgi:hypothetical protein
LFLLANADALFTPSSSRATFHHPGVFRGELMTVFTMGLVGVGVPAENINADWDCFKVVAPNTEGSSAQVVDGQAIGDRAVLEFVANPMSKFRCPLVAPNGNAEMPILVGVFRLRSAGTPSPQPAGFRFRDFGPKAFFKRDAFVFSWHPRILTQMVAEQMVTNGTEMPDVPVR